MIIIIDLIDLAARVHFIAWAEQQNFRIGQSELARTKSSANIYISNGRVNKFCQIVTQIEYEYYF